MNNTINELNNDEIFSILELKKYFEMFFENNKENYKFLHKKMKIILTGEIFRNNIDFICNLYEKYKNEKFEDFDSIIDNRMSFFSKMNLIFEENKFNELLEMLNKNEKFDTSNFEKYIKKLFDERDYTKISFIYQFIQKANICNNRKYVIDLTYSNYLLANLEQGKTLDFSKSIINLNKLFSLKYNELEIILNKLYEAPLIIDSQKNILSTIKDFLEKNKKEIIKENEAEKIEETKKYKEKLKENNFYQIYKMEFPQGYTAIIYYNKKINAFIEDIECNGKSLVMLENGKNAIKYKKGATWKSGNLYLFSYEDLKSIMTSIMNFLTYSNIEKKDENLINICNEYITNIDSTKTNEEKYKLIKKLDDDLNKFDSISNNQHISYLFDELKLMCKTLSNYYSSDNNYTITENEIKFDISQSNIIDLSSQYYTFNLPFGYYASFLDKVYGSDYVTYEQIKQKYSVSIYREEKEKFEIYYNSFRFINNLLRESESAQYISLLDQYYIPKISSMNPINNKTSNNIIKLRTK